MEQNIYDKKEIMGLNKVTPFLLRSIYKLCAHENRKIKMKDNKHNIYSENEKEKKLQVM